MKLHHDRRHDINIYLHLKHVYFLNLIVYLFSHDFFPQQLKAFYVDLIVPLESNIEKDTKVVQVYSSFILHLNCVRSLKEIVRSMKVATIQGDLFL